MQGRLTIKRMIVRDFKSFQGEVILGDLDKKFSCVIGPNGSGKSNVIDAILFVFGIAARKLRQNKVTDLIHRSTRFPSLQSAEVLVVFERVLDVPEGGIETIPNSQLVLKRTVERSSSESTKYFLDGQRVSKAQVVQTIRNLGIDLEHNRFLILQGEVEQISLMSAKGANENQVGFLEYLEDVIGTQQYVKLIQEHKEKLESVTEQRQNLVNRLKVTEKERDGLAEAHALAKRYNDFEVQLYEVQASIGLINVHIQTRACEAQKQQVDTLEEQCQELQHRQQNSVKESNEAKQQLGKLNKQLAKLKDQQEKLDAQFQELECEDGKVSNRQKHVNSQIKKTEKQLQNTQEEIANMPDPETVISNNEQNRQACANINEQKKAAEHRLQTLRDAVRGDIEEMKGRLLDLSNALGPFRQQIGQYELQQTDLQTEIQSLAKRKAEIQQKLETCGKEFQDTNTQQQQFLQQSQQLEAQINNFQATQQTQQGTYQQLQDQEQAVAGRLNELRGKVREARQSTGQNSIVQQIMRATHAGELDGIHGPLGSLGSIDDRYDVAITVAAGAKLKYIITDTLRHSEKAVQFLKDNELGVMSFQSLDGLQPPPQQPQEGLPNGIQRLYDLVRANDPKYAPAFWKALGSTLVADDIQTAYDYRRKNKNCPMIVTLKGEISKQGQMCGGGKAPRGGGMKAQQIHINPAELQQAEQQIRQLEQELRKCKDQQDQILREINTQEQEANTRNNEFQLSQRSLQEADQKLHELNQKQQRFQQELQKIIQEERTDIPQKQAQCQELENRIAHVRQQCAQLLQQEEQLKEEIENAGGPEVPVLRRQIEEMQSQIETLEENIRKAESELNQIGKMKKQKQNNVLKFQRQLEKMQAELQTLERNKNELEESGVQVDQRRQQLAQKVQEIEGRESEMRQQFEELKTAEESHRHELVEAKNKKKDKEALFNEEQKKLENWRRHYHRCQGFLRQKGYDVDEMNYALTPEQEQAQLVQLQQSEQEVQRSMKDLKPNQRAIELYEEKDKEFQERRSQVEEIVNNREQIRREYERLRTERLSKFMEGLEAINKKLGELYNMVTLGGGAAMLDLVDNSDPFAGGVNFSVRPPGKAWRNITFLSGGEKTLSSLAFIFALHHYKPTPIYIMDEIDAALDTRNVAIVSQLIQHVNKNAQFMVVSLRNTMFEQAPTLIGVCKRQDCATSITINPKEYAEKENTSILQNEWMEVDR